MKPLVPEDLARNGHARRERAATSLARAVLAEARSTFEMNRVGAAARIVTTDERSLS